jgi:hypothetical protein
MGKWDMSVSNFGWPDVSDGLFWSVDALIEDANTAPKTNMKNQNLKQI